MRAYIHKQTGINNMIFDISQHQRSYFPYKKTQTKKMGSKTGSILLLHPRNTS